MRLVLAAVDADLAQAWAKSFAGVAGVEVHRGSILDVEADAVASPANRLRRLILDRHHGELLVGHAGIVETGRPSQLG